MTFDPPSSDSRRQRTPAHYHAPAIPRQFKTELIDRAISAFAGWYTGTHCVVSFAGRLDEDRLARAMRLTVDAEPILGCRFVESWFRPCWRRVDDLDAVEFCAVRRTSNYQADLETFLETPVDLPLRSVLLRGDTDRLCIKLDHRAGDGQAMKDYVYLLADTYNRLRNDPSYVPAPNVDRKRGVRQIGDQLGLRETLRIAWQSLKFAGRQVKDVGMWKFPAPQTEFDYVIGRLDAGRVRAIFEYARNQRTTVGQVLLAAFYLAAHHVRPQSTDRPLPVRIAVDLRRHLPSKRAAAPCNLVGISLVAIDPRAGKSLDPVVTQVRDQMRSQRTGRFGLSNSTFALEAVPVIRHLVSLIPYGVMKRLARIALQQRARRGVRMVGVIFTDLGELDAARLAFAGTETTDAFVTFGAFAVPGLMMAVSGFEGALTLSLGYGPAPLVNALLEHLMRTLPM